MSRHVSSGPSGSIDRTIGRAARLAAVVACMSSPSIAGDVRIIHGPGLAPPPLAEGPRERVEQPAKPVEPRKIVRRRFPLVAYETVGSLAVRDLRLVLLGVAPLAAEERCVDPGGVEWACGGRMLAAARFALRRKPVDCDLPEGMKRGRYETSCRLDDGDLGDLVVRRGWARAVRGGPFEEAENEARREGRGLHGSAPAVETLPATLAGGDHALPVDVTTAPLSPSEPIGAKRETAPASSTPMPLADR